MAGTDSIPPQEYGSEDNINYFLLQTLSVGEGVKQCNTDILYG